MISSQTSSGGAWSTSPRSTLSAPCLIRSVIASSSWGLGGFLGYRPRNPPRSRSGATSWLRVLLGWVGCNFRVARLLAWGATSRLLYAGGFHGGGRGGGSAGRARRAAV